MKAIITGDSGFVGQELRRHLFAEGDEVLPFGPTESGFLDILDRPAVLDALAGSGAEVAYHLAALAHVGDSFNHPLNTLRVNVEGTLNVLDGCREGGIQRVLVVGSADEYGNGSSDGEAISEEAPLRPISPYAASKVAAEFLALQAHLSSGLETIMTRSFNHTGPGQARSFLIPALAGRIAEAEREGFDFIEAGRLDSVREFNDVRDIVRAYRLLTQHGRPGNVYNVCCGVAHPISEVVESLIKLSTRSLELRLDAALVRPAEASRLVGNPAKLKRDTGWEPRYTLAETLEAVLNEARSNTPGSDGPQ